MSKAFLKEEHGDAPEIVPPRAPLPPGTTNYVTPAGLAQLQAELAELGAERARLELRANEAAPAALQQLAARRAALEERLSSAVVVAARAEPDDVVRFGAEVSVRGEDGRERRYRIVGVDEADAARGKLAFTAPLSRLARSACRRKPDRPHAARGGGARDPRFDVSGVLTTRCCSDVQHRPAYTAQSAGKPGIARAEFPAPARTGKLRARETQST